MPTRGTRFDLVFFFFNDTATTEIYTLSLHDALPISFPGVARTYSEWIVNRYPPPAQRFVYIDENESLGRGDRKSTRLNSSHDQISYAVFCLKKKKTKPYGSLKLRDQMNPAASRLHE